MPNEPGGTPASTPSVPASAPAASPSPAASSSAAPTATPAKAPTTAHAALTRAAAALSDSPTSLPQPPADLGRSEDPTGTATGVPATTGSTPRSHDAPESRIEAAVRNAREKVREEFAWAQAYGGKDQIDQAVQRWQRLNANPIEFLTTLAKETGYKVVPLDQDPEPTPTPPPEDLIDPEPDLRADDGTRAYSDKAMRTLVKNETERLRRALVQEMAPALQFATEGRQQAAQAAVQAQARDFVQRSYAEVSRLPHFDRDRVSAEYRALSEAQRLEMGTHGALMTAYTNDLIKRVLPTLGQSQQASTIEDLRRSAVAGSTAAAAATPSAHPAKVSIRDGDLDGLAAHMERLAGASLATP